MKKTMMIATAIALAGCRSMTVENFGSDVVRDADGKPVMLANGEAQTVSKGWRASELAHWTDKDVKDFSAFVERGKLNVTVGSYSENVSKELVPFVKAMFDGAATLAAKVGAAIATAGGSAGADAIAGWVSKFVSAGGDVSKAKVTCADGSCTITDGNVTCIDGNCSYGE